jgi:uncharacterized protein
MPTEEHARFRAFDGLSLASTVTRPENPGQSAAVLVHGGGVTRDEAGFFTRLAAGLAMSGITVLRFDLRGHGESDGRQEDLTLCAVANDIGAAVAQVRNEARGTAAVHLYGTSFSGGISAFWAARHGTLASLTLANPLLDYKKRFIDDKPYWHDDLIDDAEGQELARTGFIAHSPAFRLGRALLNEVFWIEPRKELAELRVPTLFLHGTKDTFIPVESSRTGVAKVTAVEARLIEVEGAQHGFAVHDDPAYRDPQTRKWQEFVVSEVAGWMTGHA